jgi:hypothetical protein
VVEVVEDDDHFGQFARLSPEGLLQWHPEPPPFGDTSGMRSAKSGVIAVNPSKRR